MSPCPRKKYHIFLIFSFALIFNFVFFKNIVFGADKNHIYIMSPNGGERWKQGRTYPIIWETGTLIMTNASILVQTNDGSGFTSNWINVGSNPKTYYYTVPSNAPLNSTYSVTIKNTDAVEPLVSPRDIASSSNFFSVVSPSETNTTLSVNVWVESACGDGRRDPDEACDKGLSPTILPDLGTSTCQSYRDINNNPFQSGNLLCAEDCLSINYSRCHTCGNGDVEANEECDGLDMNGRTCQTFGFTNGNLRCNIGSCRFDSALCYSVGLPNPGQTGGGGGSPSGGGGTGVNPGFQPGSQLPPGETKVVIKGKAYPNSDVHILMDGKVIGIIKADAKADFTFETSTVDPGVATFGFWAENAEGIRSNAFSLTFRVVSGAVTTISGAYLAPSISVDKEKMNQGDTVNIFGQSIPKADIYIHINSDSEIVKQVTSDEIGAYLLPMDTSQLKDEEFHLAKSMFQVKEAGNLVRSGFSNSVSFYVGKKGQALQCSGADLNGDNRVNLTDFSILLFNWGTNNACADQNHDGTVNLFDFSIMMYYWTG